MFFFSFLKPICCFWCFVYILPFSETLSVMYYVEQPDLSITVHLLPLPLSAERTVVHHHHCLDVTFCNGYRILGYLTY